MICWVMQVETSAHIRTLDGWMQPTLKNFLGEAEFCVCVPPADFGPGQGSSYDHF